MARENKKELIGRVISDKMSKTVVVEIIQRKMHLIYRKYLKISKKVKVHDEKEISREGDKVKIIEARPISREKRWTLLEVLERFK